MAPSRTVKELGVGANFSGELSGLEETMNAIMLNELRIWLLRSLMSECLVTRDIFYFAMNQADLRITNKKLDRITMKHAMFSKIRDARQTLKTQCKRRDTHINNIREKLGGDNFRLKSWLNKLKKPINKERQKKRKKYEAKIEHYKQSQGLQMEDSQKADSKRRKETIVPYGLRAYSDISILRTPGKLPQPERPVGPFIGDKKLIFSDEERQILNRDPKYSLMYEVDDMNFQIELEKMLALQTYRDFKKRQVEKNIPLSTQLKNTMEDIKTNNETDGETVTNKKPQMTGEKDIRMEELKKAWHEIKDNHIFDPIVNRINFNNVKPTDYKHNKSIILPKPMKQEQEFEAEWRRREYLRIFEEYLTEEEQRKKDHKRKKRINNKKKRE